MSDSADNKSDKDDAHYILEEYKKSWEHGAALQEGSATERLNVLQVGLSADLHLKLKLKFKFG